MKRLLILGIALFGLLGLGAPAGAAEQPFSHTWFFGNCEEENGDPELTAAGQGEGCRGFGVFIGGFDKASLIEAILADAADDGIGGDLYLSKLFAFQVGAQFVPPIIGSEGEDVCPQPFAAAEPWEIETNGQVGASGGLWVAWFSVERCPPLYTLIGNATAFALFGQSPIVILRSDPSLGFGAIDFRIPEGLKLNELTELSADVFLEADDVCEGFSPAFTIDVDTNGDGFTDGVVYVKLGPESGAPACLPGAWQNTTNLLQPGRDLDTQYLPGGTQYHDYTEAMEAFGDGTVRRLLFVVNGGSARPDEEQTLNVDTIVINGKAYTFDELLD